MNDTLAPLRTALADRYTVEREVGAGGMARVVAAEDVKHRRKVAIKLLRPELSQALGVERFLREIETIASLRHPHILPLFDSGEADGSLYYVMPLVEGESLRARLDREKQLPLEEAIQITREVAGALTYAHNRGVIHRDIKPENVLLESGHAVVTDFGIARVVTAADGARTQPGLALGTPRYMSPEQAAGETDVDGRTDQYSLACTLYEMLAGQPPFTGPTVDRMVYQHLVEPPPSITHFRPAVPAGVVSAIRRALSKTPADRFSTTAAFAEALTKPANERSGVRSVAVLPFLNLSTDPENEYFADGITEDVIAQLSKIRSLKVVSRTSVMQFKRREHDLREIAARLQVGALLDGSVRRAGSRVRIVAQLIEAETDAHLWAETYDRDLTDIFAIQSEVALHIAGALEATLSSDERTRIARKPTTDVRAYQLYLQGRQCLIRFNEDGMRTSISFFERAIEADPGYALAYSGIALALAELAETGALRPEEAYPRATAAAAKALELDPELGDAYCTAALCKLVYEYDWTGAEEGFKRAIELSPNSADAYDLYGRLCGGLQRYDEAIAMLQRSHELDPLAHRVDLATAYLRAGRYEEALRASTGAVEFDRSDSRARATIGWAHFLMGRESEGLAELERAVELAPRNFAWLAQLGEAYGLAGKADKARAILAQLIGQSHTRYVSPYQLAYVYTGLGQHEEALDCLERAFEQRAGAVHGIGGSFLFASLRSHPRFQALLRRLHVA